MKIHFNVGLLFFFFFGSLHAEVVEIVSDMYTEEILSEECFTKIKDIYEVRFVDQKHHREITTRFDEVKKFVIFNGHDKLADLSACPSEKKVLFVMEPKRLNAKHKEAFSRIYTWDDDVIDGKQNFKFYFPDLMPMTDSLIPFEKKKLCTMIVRNWHALHRRPIVEFFETKPLGEFHFYGSPFPILAHNKLYRGRIPGLNCGKEKIEVLKNYRFCICFENITTYNGYISEKIFPCFAAGCVPVYWGAPNVEKYIPKDCFIDYRDFKNLEELYHFIKEMPQEVYEGYLERIRVFLQSEPAQLFSSKHFAQLLYEAVTQ